MTSTFSATLTDLSGRSSPALTPTSRSAEVQRTHTLVLTFGARQTLAAHRPPQRASGCEASGPLVPLRRGNQAGRPRLVGFRRRLHPRLELGGEASLDPPSR